jgi:hypothetical protein
MTFRGRFGAGWSESHRERRSQSIGYEMSRDVPELGARDLGQILKVQSPRNEPERLAGSLFGDATREAATGTVHRSTLATLYQRPTVFRFASRMSALRVAPWEMRLSPCKQQTYARSQHHAGRVCVACAHPAGVHAGNRPAVLDRELLGGPSRPPRPPAGTAPPPRKSLT